MAFDAILEQLSVALGQRGMDVEPLAKYMGTSPEILREHYASILP